jgi:hypothetical protein
VYLKLHIASLYSLSSFHSQHLAYLGDAPQKNQLPHPRPPHLPRYKGAWAPKVFVVWSDWKRAPGVWNDDIEKKSTRALKVTVSEIIVCSLTSTLKLKLKIDNNYINIFHWVVAHVHGFQTM